MKKILFLFLILSVSALSVSAANLSNASAFDKRPPILINPAEPVVLNDVQVVGDVIRFTFNRRVYVYDAVVRYPESYNPDSNINMENIYVFYANVSVVDVPVPTRRGTFEITVNTLSGKYTVRGFLTQYGDVALDWASSIDLSFR